MNFSQIKKILLRVFNSYVRKHLNKLIISLFLSLVVAGSTGAIAWLLDPAVKKIFKVFNPESCLLAFKNNNLIGSLIFIFIFSFNIL